jgi:hypothetical protein
MAEDRILVVFAEEMFAQPDAVRRRCFAFLGVDPDVALPDSRLHLNRGSHKLYDSAELREMRSLRLRPRTAEALARVLPDTQDQFLEKLGLRRPFSGGALCWPEAARRHVVEALHDDIARFLAQHGKPFDYWPRFAAACRGDPGALDGERIP